MVDVVLIEPEIPPNTGNVIRLCANTGAALHLVEPLGFALDEPRLRRAGLDYREWARIEVHASFDAYLDAARPGRLLAFSRHAQRCYSEIRYRDDDALMFGAESRGLAPQLLARVAERNRLRIPMRDRSRSLNLSNAVAVACYEAWRQRRFAGAATRPR